MKRKLNDMAEAEKKLHKELLVSNKESMQSELAGIGGEELVEVSLNYNF